MKKEELRKELNLLEDVVVKLDWDIKETNVSGNYYTNGKLTIGIDNKHKYYTLFENDDYDWSDKKSDGKTETEWTGEDILTSPHINNMINNYNEIILRENLRKML